MKKVKADKWRRFQKKPVEISAMRFDAGRIESPEGVCYCNDVPLGGQPHCHTLEGHHVVSDGDWVIRGIKGEFYPCKPDIFKLTYRAVAKRLTKETSK